MTEGRRSETDVDVTTVRRLARLAGFELSAGRAERLAPDLVALIEADRRLAVLDLRGRATTGDPWAGRSSMTDRSTSSWPS